MAKASINSGGAVEPVHTRTTAGSEESQVAVIGIDGSDSVVGADTANGLDVDVTRLPSLPAGTNNIGDVDVVTLPTATVRHAGTTGAQTSVAATVTANTTLIAADANRFGLNIFNESASATLFVLMGAGTESATVYTTQVPPNWNYEVPDAFVTLRASGHWSAAVGSARITAVT